MANLPSANFEIQSVLNQGESSDFLLNDLLDCTKPAAPRGKSSFTIPPSKLMRGKPYYNHDQLLWVMTKPGSHFPVVLKGTQIGDTIRISVLYNHEDHMGDRVKCSNLEKRHEPVFDVELRSAGLERAPFSPHNNLTLCSVTLLNSKCESDEVSFRFKPNCLNSCSKPESCSERLLKLEHLSKDGTILTTSTWNLRVSSFPKRDFDNMLESVDHNTGEKHKSLYGKTSKNKKVKKEHQELAPAYAEQEHQDTLSCPATRRELEVGDTAAKVITGQASSDQLFSSVEVGMEDGIVHVCNSEASEPLLEEKGSAQCTKTEHQLTGTSVAPQPIRCNSFNVQMNNLKGKKFVKKLIFFFGGKVHELET